MTHLKEEQGSWLSQSESCMHIPEVVEPSGPLFPRLLPLPLLPPPCPPSSKAGRSRQRSSTTRRYRFGLRLLHAAGRPRTEQEATGQHACALMHLSPLHIFGRGTPWHPDGAIAFTPWRDMFSDGVTWSHERPQSLSKSNDSTRFFSPPSPSGGGRHASIPARGGMARRENKQESREQGLEKEASREQRDARGQASPS